MKEIREVTLGADPEVFVCTHDGEVGVSIGLLGGTKKDPRPVPFGAVQEDNVLAEFNIAPAETPEAWERNLSEVMASLQKLLPAGSSLLVKSSHKYDLDFLRALGPQAMEFGCDPDLYLVTPAGMGTPDPGLRTAGGHIHIGYADPNEAINRDLVMAMDLFLGLPSLLMDEDDDRRALYGAASCHRHKPYGVEYRTLSNFWLRTPALRRWAFDQTQRAVDVARTGVHKALAGYGIGHPDICRIINGSDRSTAAEIVEEFKLEVCHE